jgi:hypothetical protein
MTDTDAALRALRRAHEALLDDPDDERVRAAWERARDRVPPDALLWSEDVQAFLGITRAHTVRRETALTRKRIREEGQPRPTDMALPVDNERREVPTLAGDTRVTISPRWRAGEVAQVVEARRVNSGPGGNRGNRRHDPDTGKFAPGEAEAVAS